MRILTLLPVVISLNAYGCSSATAYKNGAIKPIGGKLYLARISFHRVTIAANTGALAEVPDSRVTLNEY